MRFVLIVKDIKDSEAGFMSGTKLLTAMGRFNEELFKAGVLLAGEGLQASSKGARVHFNNARRTVHNGPFAELNGLIAGFWLIQARSLAEAIEWVRRCPNPHNEDTHIETRPICEADDFGEPFSPELREQEERLRERMADGSCEFQLRNKATRVFRLVARHRPHALPTIP